MNLLVLILNIEVIGVLMRVLLFWKILLFVDV